MNSFARVCLFFRDALLACSWCLALPLLVFGFAAREPRTGLDLQWTGETSRRWSMQASLSFISFVCLGNLS